MDNKSNISGNIAFLRKSKKISQKDLGEVIGKKNSVVSAYEKGVALPSLDVAKKIADFFEISVDALISEDLSRNQKIMDISKRYLTRKANKTDEEHKLFMKNAKSLMRRHNTFMSVMNKILDYDELRRFEDSLFIASQYFVYYHSNLADKIYMDMEDSYPYIKDVKSYVQKHKKEIQSFQNLIETYSTALTELAKANKKFGDDHDFLKIYELRIDTFLKE